MSYQTSHSSQDNGVIPVDAKSTQRLPICPNCSYPFRHGELACNNCGIVFSAAGRTKTINGFKQGNLEQVRRVGEAIVHQACAITLNIGDEPMVLPNAKTVVLGRETMMTDALQPDVDLSPYGAHENGISHLHLKVIPQAQPDLCGGFRQHEWNFPKRRPADAKAGTGTPQRRRADFRPFARVR